MWKRKTINSRLEQLQLLKAQLLTSKAKISAVPTVAVDPQVVETDLKKLNYAENDMDNDNEQYVTYEQTSTPDCTSDYNWQEKNIPNEGVQHTKQL